MINYLLLLSLSFIINTTHIIAIYEYLNTILNVIWLHVKKSETPTRVNFSEIPTCSWNIWVIFQGTLNRLFLTACYLVVLCRERPIVMNHKTENSRVLATKLSSSIQVQQHSLLFIVLVYHTWTGILEFEVRISHFRLRKAFCIFQ